MADCQRAPAREAENRQTDAERKGNDAGEIARSGDGLEIRHLSHWRDISAAGWVRQTLPSSNGRGWFNYLPV